MALLTFTLGPRRRALLFLASAACYVAGLLDAGQSAPAQGAVDFVRGAPPADPRSRGAVAATIARDPFEPTPGPLPAPSASWHNTPLGDAQRPNPLDPLASVQGEPEVPDIAPDGDGEAPPERTYRLRATIVSRSSVAYIDDGKTMTIARTGDEVAGRRVVRIELDGISFADGTRLRLSDHGMPSRATPRAAHVISASAQPREIRATTAASALGPVTAPSAAETYPTPGPLPTIKGGTYPVGRTPTSDPSAPTAYPYPYPYAPR